MDFSYRETLGLNCSGVFYLWGYGEGRQTEILSGKRVYDTYYGWGNPDKFQIPQRGWITCGKLFYVSGCG